MLRWSVWSLVACLLGVAKAGFPDLCTKTNICNTGGDTNQPCHINTRGCPPCIMLNKACFQYDPVTNKCPFQGGADCLDYYNSLNDPVSSSSKAGSSGSSTKKPNTNSSSPKPNNGSGTSEKSATDAPKKSSDNNSIVFAIVGAAIGVVAVAVIFVTLLRRSQAADEDDEELETTPQTYHKPYQNSTFNSVGGGLSQLDANSSAAAPKSSRYYEPGENASLSGTMNSCGSSVATTSTSISIQQPNKPMQMVHRKAVPTAVPCSAVPAPSHLPVNPPRNSAQQAEKQQRDSYEF